MLPCPLDGDLVRLDSLPGRQAAPVDPPAQRSSTNRAAFSVRRLSIGVVVGLLSMLSILIVFAVTSRTVATEGTPLSAPPPSPSITLQPAAISNTTWAVDRSFSSFSIEYSYFQDYVGNVSHPNLFTKQVIDNVVNLTGQSPYLRIGGSTQDESLYNASLPPNKSSVQYFTAANADQPANLTVGPNWFKSLTLLPNTRFIWGLNLKNNDSQHLPFKATTSLLESAFEVIKYANLSNLESFEVGNEPDAYPPGARPAKYSNAAYVLEWLNRTREIAADSLPAIDNTKPMFQGGAITLNHHNFTTIALLQDGINTDGRVKSMSTHLYFGDQCSTTDARRVNMSILVNHTTIASTLVQFINESNYVQSKGLQYVIGETNSIACQGLDGVSNIFGAAIWAVDYMMYAAANRILRLYFHQGTVYRYSAWQPVMSNGTAPYVKPPYYANILMASVIGQNSNMHIEELTATTSNKSISAYASYVSGSLDKVIIVNLDIWNTTTPYARPSQNLTVDLPSDVREVVVQRMTAPGSDSRSGVTWDGMSYGVDAKSFAVVGGEGQTEMLDVGVKSSVEVSVLSTEAVVLVLQR